MHQSISFFDIFKIGIGPSSSHTLGPWKAALMFCKFLQDNQLLSNTISIKVLLYGSLAKTGKGHGTDVAIQLGLSGEDPVKFDVDQVNKKITSIGEAGKINLNGKQIIDFNPKTDIEFLFTETLTHHPNGMSFLATISSGEHIAKTYFSIGGSLGSYLN